MTDGIRLEREGSVAWIILDRTEVGNAVDIPMARALRDAAIAYDEDDGIRCVVVTGSGRFFCTGGDVASFVDAGVALPKRMKEITSDLHSAIARLVRMDKPVLTAINGPAAGAGVGLALAGDIVVASAAAHFTLAYTGIGMSPDAAATWLLPRLVGLRRAQELCITNRRVGAEEALSIGLVTSIVADAAFDEAVKDAAASLARSATSAIAATRRLLLASSGTMIETQMELESRAIAAQANTSEGREGIAAFAAKRRPDFN